MSSKIKVDSIETVSGSGTISIPTGNNLSVAGTSTLTGNTSVGGNLAVTGNLTVSGTNNIAGAGSVLETLTSLADGSTVTVGSGTYTFQNVTAAQAGTTSYVDLNGSTISYKPPTGTTKVIYEFTYMFARTGDAGPLGHHKFFIDSVEVTNARWDNGGSTFYGMLQTFKWVINPSYSQSFGQNNPRQSYSVGRACAQAQQRTRSGLCRCTGGKNIISQT